MFFRGGEGGGHRVHACTRTCIFKHALPSACNCKLVHEILGVRLFAIPTPLMYIIYF